MQDILEIAVGALVGIVALFWTIFLAAYGWDWYERRGAERWLRKR